MIFLKYLYAKEKNRRKIKAVTTILLSNADANPNSPQKFYGSTDLPIKLSSYGRDINYIRCKVNWEEE